MGLFEGFESGSLSTANEGFSPFRDQAMQLMQEHMKLLRHQPQESNDQVANPGGVLAPIEITGDDGKPLAKGGLSQGNDGNQGADKADDKVGDKAGDKPGDKPAAKSDDKAGDKPADKPADKADEKTGDKTGDKADEKKPAKSKEERELDDFTGRLEKLQADEKKGPLTAEEKQAKATLEKAIPNLRNVVNDQHEERYEGLADKVKAGRATDAEKKEFEGRQKEHDEVERKSKEYYELIQKLSGGGKLTEKENKSFEELRHNKAVRRCADWMHKDDAE